MQGYTLFTFRVEFVSLVLEDLLEIHGTYQLLVCAGISASGLCGKSAGQWEIGFWSVGQIG